MLAFGGLAAASVASATAFPSVSSVTANSSSVAPDLLPIPLQEGVNNPSAVKLWQQDLNFYIHVKLTCRPTLAVDGQFGPATKNATECFQSRSNISIDGIVGPVTRNAMCSFLFVEPNDTTIWFDTCV
jgi:peptidoglycan hydrolase-like protein with peptidoglycan-binding domain